MRLAIIDAHPLAQTWLSGENSRHECLSQDLAVPCRTMFCVCHCLPGSAHAGELELKYVTFRKGSWDRVAVNGGLVQGWAGVPAGQLVVA